MIRVPFPKPIRKRPRSKHKFQPILSRMSACKPNMYCDTCLEKFQSQVDNDRPNHVWRVINGEVRYLEDVLMEHHLGRELKPTETVIHKNGLPTDNRFQNLEVITIDKLDTE